MRYVDVETWDRKKYIDMFEKYAITKYSVTVDIDVTSFLEKTKKRGRSFYASFVYVSTKALNAVEPFRFRRIGDAYAVIDRMDSVLAVMTPGDTAFRNITLRSDVSPDVFEANYKSSLETPGEADIMIDGAKDIWPAYHSTTPWYSFTGLSPLPDPDKWNNDPLIICGKFRNENGKVMMPTAIQANHIFVQGNDIGAYLDRLAAEMRSF